MISHRVLSGGDLDAAVSSLRRYLPFSVNAIDCIRNHPDRTSVFAFQKDGKDAGLSVTFYSGYNPHVWFDPVVWIVDGCEYHEEIAEFLQNALGKTFVAHFYCTCKDKSQFEVKWKWKFYTELIMSTRAIVSDIEDEEKYHFLPVSGDESLEVFSFLSDVSHISDDHMNREGKFLLERDVYAIKFNGRIASMAAIMSSYSGITSIGAIKTDPKHRRQGLARYLVSKLVNQILLNQQQVILFVRDDNYPAIRLYESLGFREVGRSTFMDHGANVKP